MNKQTSKNYLIPTYTVSMDSNSQLHKKKNRKHQFSTNHSNSNNLIFKEKKMNSNLIVKDNSKMLESTGGSNYGKVAQSDRSRNPSKVKTSSTGNDIKYAKKRSDSGSKYNPIFTLGLTRRKKKIK